MTRVWRVSYWVAHPQLLASLNSEAFPNVSARVGGEIKGLPVIPSSAVPLDSNQAHQLSRATMGVVMSVNG